MTDLWRLAIEWMRHDPLSSAPTGQDRARVRWLLWELYLLGERPTVGEIRVAGGVDGEAIDWSRALATLWGKRLNNPLRICREGYRRYSFVIPALLVDDHHLRSIEDRLADEVERAARAYAATVASGGSETELLPGDRALQMQSHALRVWGQTQDVLRHDPEGEVWGAGLALRFGPRLVVRHPG